MIIVRKPGELFDASGRIQNGTFKGKWHFWFDQYRDPSWVHFGTLRVLNDDILSPGAIWSLHYHKRNEVVTYVAKGEFKHADEHGEGGIMKKGDVQHTTIGKGMYHSEINNKKDEEMRFIQMWFFPEQENLNPNYSQKSTTQEERKNRLLPLVSQHHENSLRIKSAVEVFSSYLENKVEIEFTPRKGWGVYIVLLEGQSLKINDKTIEERGAAAITNEDTITLVASGNCELLLIHVSLVAPYIEKYTAHYPKP